MPEILTFIQINRDLKIPRRARLRRAILREKTGTGRVREDCLRVVKICSLRRERVNKDNTNVKFFLKMSSFKKARNAVAMAYDASWIDDEEFVLLYDACYSKNPEIVHKEYQIFDLEELDETECVMDFRFKKHEIPILGMALGLPQHFRCKQGTVCDRIEALCITLRRFTYPCRYSDLVPIFGRSVPI